MVWPRVGGGTAKIVIVTNNPGDEADYTPFLQSILGYDITVETEDDKYIDPLNAAVKADLRAADLIIVSRRTSSGKFTAEIEFWNGLETPMLLHSAFLIGDSRWGWMPGGNENVDLTDVSVFDQEDPILGGVTVTDGQVKIFTTLVPGLDVSSQGSAGNGTKVATPAGKDKVMIAHWEAGTEYYAGSGQIAGGPRVFFGMRTDEFFPFVNDDGKKMLENAILMLMGLLRGVPVALDPNPAGGQTDVARDAVLAWTPGDVADTHDVYFGTSFADVNDASRANPLGVLRSQGQSDNTYVPVGLLEFGRTYYWRIDEVTAPPDSTVFKGELWSFTAEPFALQATSLTVTASSSSIGKVPENTANGSGLDANDLHSTEDGTMWLSDLNGAQPTWIEYEFDKIYKLHEMWVWNHNGAYEQTMGIGARDVTIEYSVDGVHYETLSTTHEFAQAPGTTGYAHNTIVDFTGTTARYVRLAVNSNWGGIFTQYGLSEVRFFNIPLSAREPSPDSGATDVDVNVTFGWRAGREVATHDLYLSTDEQAVTDGTIPAVSVADASYSSALDLGTSYFWRIDEVNDAETPTTWKGDVWNLTTQEFIVVDDFESYNDIDPPDPESNRIFESWPDGFGVATNGALVGNDPPQPSYAEVVIVHGGAQSMPMFYSNTLGATYSEATRTFAAPQDWANYGIQTLQLWFYGTEGNTGQLYLKINDVKVSYDGDAANLGAASWQPWDIDLATVGVNLQSVTGLAIGIDGNAAAGTLYIDDIRLYGAPAAPADLNLVAW